MVTDRSITSGLKYLFYLIYLGLLVYLSHLYYNPTSNRVLFTSPLGRWSITIFSLLIMIDISSHYIHMLWSSKSGASSHKSISSNYSSLLKTYYESRLVLFFLCAGDQLFWITLYSLRSVPFTHISSIIIYCSLAVSAPICLVKQIINIIQLLHASSNLAKADFLAKTK
jgi:hypothetical protein